jgi:hypothetical protein
MVLIDGPTEVHNSRHWTSDTLDNGKNRQASPVWRRHPIEDLWLDMNTYSLVPVRDR